MTPDELVGECFRLKPYLMNGLVMRGVRYCEVESIVMEVIQLVVARSDALPDMSAQQLRNYLASACRNKMIDTFERPSYREAAREREYTLGLRSPAPTPLDCDLSRDRCAEIRRAAGEVHRHGPEILDMLAAGCTQAEIGTKLGLTGGRMSQIVLLIRERLEKRLPDIMAVS